MNEALSRFWMRAERVDHMAFLKNLSYSHRKADESISGTQSNSAYKSDGAAEADDM